MKERFKQIQNRPTGLKKGQVRMYQNKLVTDEDENGNVVRTHLVKDPKTGVYRNERSN